MALTTNLVAYYKFDESSGNAADSVGSATLVNTGTCTYAAAKINNGVVTTASSKYMTHASIETIMGTNPTAWSVGCWFKHTYTAGNPNIVSDYYSTSGSATVFGFDIYFGGGGVVLADARQASTTYSTTSGDYDATNFGDGNWHHVVLTADKGVPELKQYVDGILRDTVAINGSADYFSATPWYVGVILFNNIPTGGLTGSVDELGLLTRALTSGEVTSLYNGGMGTQYPFVVAYTLTAALGTFTLTGVSATIGYLYTLVASVGSFVLTGIDATLKRTGWSNPFSKNAISPSNVSKTSSTWSNRGKDQ